MRDMSCAFHDASHSAAIAVASSISVLGIVVVYGDGVVRQDGCLSKSSTFWLIHGAIRYTMEFPLQLLMRRVFRLGASFGSGAVLSDRLFELFKQSR